MENVISIPRLRSDNAPFRSTGWDTALVLFFLSMDLGGGLNSIDFGTVLSVLSILAFAIFPYVIQFTGKKPSFSVWIIGRLFIAAMGVTVGGTVNAIAEVFLMENLKFLPMTLLIISGIFCAATQIRDIIRFRLAS